MKFKCIKYALQLFPHKMTKLMNKFFRYVSFYTISQHLDCNNLLRNVIGNEINHKLLIISTLFHLLETCNYVLCGTTECTYLGKDGDETQ